MKPNKNFTKMNDQIGKRTSLNEKLNNNFFKRVTHSNSLSNLAQTQSNFGNALLESMEKNSLNN